MNITLKSASAPTLQITLFSRFLIAFALFVCSHELMAAKFTMSIYTGGGTPTVMTTADDGTTTLTATRSDGGNLAGVSSGFLDPSVMGGADTYTVTFNVPITISSIQIAEFTNNSTGNHYVLTPNVGTPFNIADNDSFLAASVIGHSPVNWIGVTSLTYSYSASGWRNGLDNLVFTVTPPPSITSATYDANIGILMVTAASITSGDTIDVSKLTLTGRNDDTYTLTSPNVTASSSSAFSVTLNATDKLAINGLLNQGGFYSINGSVYNLAAVANWNATASSPDDLTGNGITVTNVSAPTITSANYDSSTHVLNVIGTNLVGILGAGDISVSLLTMIGEGGTTYTLTSSDVEVTSTASFSVTLNSTDFGVVETIFNKAGTSSTSGTTYTIAAADDWNSEITGSNIADSSNVITVSNVALPEITGGIYDAGNGVLTVTGSGIVSRTGGSNDIDVSKFTLSGDDSSYTLTSDSIDITNGSSFSVTLNGTDKNALLSRLNKDGFNSIGAVAYNIAAAEDWNTGADPALTIADLANNAITVSNAATVSEAPSIGTAIAGDAQANVSFTAPGNNGGAAITAYTITSSPGGLTASGAASPLTVSGLANGTVYTFSVTATNAAGISGASTSSNSVIPKGIQSITFTNPSAQNFGSSPTLTASSSSGLMPAFTSSTTGVCTVTISGGLTFVNSGICTINANQNGNHAYLPAVQVSRSFSINAVIAGAPSIGAAVASDAQANVSFSAPASNGGAAITSYSVTSSPGGIKASGVASPLTVTGLTNGTPYSFTVTAKNSAGVSAASASSVTVTPNGAPAISGTPSVSVQQGVAYSFTAVASDSPGDNLTFSISNKPNWATFSSATGSLTGTPTNADVGTTSGVVISVSDGSLSAALPAFNLTVANVNDAPTITGLPIMTVEQGMTYQFAPVVSDIDVDTTLTFSISNKPGWASFSSTTGSLTGTPTNADVGTTSGIVISVSDGSLSAELPAFNLSVNNVNDAPIISGTPSTTVDEDTAYYFEPEVSDIDAGTTLTFSINNKPSWASFSRTTGSLTGTPTNSDIGTTSDIVISVSDGNLSAVLPAFNLSVNNVNDAPIAEDDSLILPIATDNTYTLDVLINDTDPDQDNLSIDAANANLGNVSISNNKLLFIAPDNFSGIVTLSYSITDGEFSDLALVTLQIVGSNPGAPVITLPDDLNVNSTGLFTKVNVGIASAVDADGNRLAVSLLNGLPMFAPGKHQLIWQATDSNDISTTTTQLLLVQPQVSLGKPQTVVNNSNVTVAAILNGLPQTYPVDIAYLVTDSSTSTSEHNLVSGSVTITSGLTANISFDVYADLSTQSEKDIVITLDNTLNLGANSSTTITITNENIAPSIELNVRQQDQSRLLIGKDAGVVTINALVDDPNLADTVSLEWTADMDLDNISTDISQFIFDPANLNSGVYKISVTATDNATSALSRTNDAYILVQDVLPTLGSDDSNNNLIPDNIEGLADNNQNGIPNYLDPGFACHIMAEKLVNTSQFIAEGEPGTCLRKGVSSILSNTGGIQLTSAELQLLETDTEAQITGGSFDFILHSLAKAGDSYRLVLPQLQPVPGNAVYRKFSQENGWANFVINQKNQLFSTAGEPGFCPSPGNSVWQEGLTAGHWCVQLLIEDGGANDADGLVNGTIVDPGGVATLRNSNTLPIATKDSYSVQWNQNHILNVLDNDTDVDSDELTIIQSSAAFGSVSVSEDGLSLLYSPGSDFVGTDTVSYSIADGNGGSAGATVTVVVYYNRPPVVANFSVNTDDQTAIDIDVLANATDPDGDNLIISEASAQQGSVVITAGQTLLYTPQSGFGGIDRISFSVSDNLSGSVSGEVMVNIQAREIITINNKSSGGATGIWSLIILSLLLLCRRKFSVILAGTLLVLSSLVTVQASDFTVDGFIGKSNARQSANDIRADLPTEATLLQYDNRSTSFALGISYKMKERLALQVHFVDLGEASLSIEGESLTPENLHRELSEVGPLLVKGIRSGLSYSWWQTDVWSSSVQIGLFNWWHDSSSQFGEQLISNSDSGTDMYLGLAVGYKLTEKLTLALNFSRYTLPDNKVDNLMMGISYYF